MNYDYYFIIFIVIHHLFEVMIVVMNILDLILITIKIIITVFQNLVMKLRIRVIGEFVLIYSCLKPDFLIGMLLEIFVIIIIVTMIMIMIMIVVIITILKYQALVQNLAILNLFF